MTRWLRCSTDRELAPDAADHTDADGVREAERIPIAMTQSPGCICDESPNLISGSR
jgi:hypothetical protein